MNEFLVQLIVVAVAANVVLLLAALIVPRVRRSGRPAAASPVSGGNGTLALAGATPGPIVMTAAPEGAFGPSASGLAAEPQGDTSTVMPSDAEDIQRSRRFALPSDDDYPTTESVEAFLAAGQRGERSVEPALVDGVTGLDTGLAWELAVSHEDARHSRYGRPVTIVIAELDRLEALAARLGQENADRLIPPVATTLRRLARSADLVARVGHARFQALLPETDEVQAINYVERVRDACDIWLDAAAVSVRLSVGWASAAAGTSLRDAIRLAEQRMHADRARASLGRTGQGRSTAAPMSAPERPFAPTAPSAPPAPTWPAEPAPSSPALPEDQSDGQAPSEYPAPNPPASESPGPDAPFRPGPGTGPTM